MMFGKLDGFMQNNELGPSSYGIFKNKLKVSPLTIMASVVVGGTAFGILGFLLSPPIVATIKAYFSVFIKTKPDKSQ